MVFGMVPHFLLKWLSKRFFNSPKFKEVISIFNCFSGGVFFATSVLAILPEARMKMEELLTRLSSDVTYPLTEAMLGIGFLGILLIENITLTCCTRNRDGSYEEFGTDASGQTYGSTSQTSETDKETDETQSPEKSTDDGKEITESSAEPRPGQESVTGCYANVTDLTNLRNVVLVLALSVHMVFDGLELGLLDSDDKVWSLLLALCIHKSLIFFSVGLTLSETVPYTKTVFSIIFAMAVVSPLGGALGILLTVKTHGVVTKTVSAFLQGVAVGTFLYVTFFEILQREFNKKVSAGILRSFSVIYGFFLFAILQYVCM